MRELEGQRRRMNTFELAGRKGVVWALHTTVEEATKKGIGLVHNAYNMEERCRVIEHIGGIFYADPKDCPYLDLS